MIGRVEKASIKNKGLQSIRPPAFEMTVVVYHVRLCIYIEAF